MRVEPITVDCFAHCLKRGGRGMPIVRDEADRWRFIRSLYYLNDSFFDPEWNRALFFNSSNGQTVGGKNRLFFRPSEWPIRKPLVKILAYILMPNHLHLLCKEINTGGISDFMKKLGQSMSQYFNEKYANKGSIFQGAYKSRTINTDEYLRYLSVYIMVKNAFELYPMGLEKAMEDFESAWKFAVAYPFSSLADYVSGRESPIVDKDLLGEIFVNPAEFKSFSRDVIHGGKWGNDDRLAKLVLE